MTEKNQTQSTCRWRFLISGVAAGLAAATLPATLKVQETNSGDGFVFRNVSSFRTHDWRDHFNTLENGVILADTTSKMLQYWSEDESLYKVFPAGAPLSDDLTQLGYTRIVRKVEGPGWAPTPAMNERNPECPDFVRPGSENPLGTHALYLSWQYYRIHGTNDTHKIGRKSSNGCIGLCNEQIAELFSLTNVGTRVKLI